MWIYSLGITLRRTMQTFSSTTSQHGKTSTTNALNTDTNTTSKPKNYTTLEHVIRAMCAPNIVYRASLMYLLDVSKVKVEFSENLAYSQMMPLAILRLTNNNG